MSGTTEQLIATLLSLVAALQGIVDDSSPRAYASTQFDTSLLSAINLVEASPLPAVESSVIRDVPFYSQFNDISDPSWKGVGCGITSLAMLIDYYKPAVSVDVLLNEGIQAGAYLDSAGWTYAGLIGVSKKYGLDGRSFDLGGSSMGTAYAKFKTAVDAGPVIASVYYTFTPGHPIPHLVVVNDISDGNVYYNDPAEADGGGIISVEKFQAAWKKRYIEIYPAA